MTDEEKKARTENVMTALGQAIAGFPELEGAMGTLLLRFKDGTLAQVQLLAERPNESEPLEQSCQIH